MNSTKTRISLAILMLIGALLLLPSIAQAQEKHNTTLYFFWGVGCPYCEHQKPFLEELQDKYPELEVKSYETWYNPENARLFSEIAEGFGTRASGVPTTFLDDKVWVGYSSYMDAEIEEAIKYCIEHGCIDPIERTGKAVESITRSIETISPIEAVCVHVFLHGDCLQCENILPRLNELKEKYNIDIMIHDVSISEEKELYEKFKETYGLAYGAYPIAFIGEKFFIGEKQIEENLENEIISCAEKGCICPTEKITGIMSVMPRQSEYTGEKTETITIPLIGEIDLGAMPMGMVTVLISFIDGFNPCSLWVLTFLLGIVIYSGSRKRIAIIGLTYLLVTASVYGLFIVGMLNVFTYIGFVGWIRAIVAFFALTFAIVNIKDFFWYKKGISFTIPDKYKPKIFKDVRKVLDPKKSIYSMIGATIIMALGITLVELPCTAGFPVLWTGMIAAQGISMTSLYFISLLAIYLLIYLSIELVIFFGTVYTLKKTRFEEKHGRILKLIGGAIMLALGLTFAFKPEYMENMGATITLFTASIIIAVIVGWLYQKYIGFDEKNAKNVCVACNILGLDKQNSAEKENKEGVVEDKTTEEKQEEQKEIAKDEQIHEEPKDEIESNIKKNVDNDITNKGD